MRNSQMMRRTAATWIALAAALAYCLNVDNLLGYVRLRPMAYQFAGAAGVFIFFSMLASRSIPSRIVSLLRNPLIRWLSFLILISLPYSIISEASLSSQGLSYLVTTSLIVTTLVLCTEEMAWSNTQSAMITLAVVVACLSVLADPLIDFRQFFPQLADEGYERTRAAGVFLQPNIASTSLAFLLAAAIPRVSRFTAVLLSLLVAVAVFLTFSRSGFILLGLVILLGAWRGFLPRYIVLTVLIGAFAWTTTLKDVIIDTFGIHEGSGYVRLIHLQDMLTSSALLNDTRTATAEQAYSDFVGAPLGQGLGYSWRWAQMQPDQQGTHNQNLRYMLEYGITGFFVWPLFLVALFRSRDRNIDFVWGLGICFCGFIASLFSHNLTETGAILAPLIGALLWPPAPEVVAVKRRARRELSLGGMGS